MKTERRQTGRRGLAGIMLSVFLVSIPVAGRADDERSQAKELANRAYDLLSDGEYERAVGLFLEADALVHSPVFLVFAAQAEEKRGRLIAAADLLSRVTGEVLPDQAPASFRRAQAKARKRRADLEARIPRLTIRLEGEGRVTLDGVAVAPDALGTRRKLDPGTYVVGAEGVASAEQKTVELSEGAREIVVLRLGGPTPSPDSADERQAPGMPATTVGAIASLSLAGAGLVLGAVTGGIFIGRADRLKKACENDLDGDPLRCPDADEIDDVKLLGNLSTAGWAIAGVGAAAGAVLFIAGGDEEEPTAVTWRLSPTGMSIRGRF